MTKLYGIRSLRVEKDAGEPTRIYAEFIASPNYNPYHFENENWNELFPGDVVVKCSHCGQWGARKTDCKHCGASIA